MPACVFTAQDSIERMRVSGKCPTGSVSDFDALPYTRAAGQLYSVCSISGTGADDKRAEATRRALADQPATAHTANKS